MAKILLTRPEKFSQKTAQDLASKNISFIIQPLFSIAPEENLPTINQPLQAILITSAAAVFALSKLMIEKNILILAVGAKTAAAVKNCGYENVVIANNSAVSLLDLAAHKLNINQGLVLYLSGAIITLDLAKKLAKQGFETQRIIVYKTIATEKLSAGAIDEIKNGNVSEAWLYSKKSVQILRQLALKHNLLECFSKIKILCLSREIADLASQIGFQKVGII